MIEDDLEPLITRCPSCSTQFRVTESQLAVAAGQVRCGACLTVFGGTDHMLLDEESTFASGSDADAALDELLSELGGPAVTGDDALHDLPAREPQEAENFTAAEEVDEPRQLYGGFEDDEPSDDFGLQDSNIDDAEPGFDEIDEIDEIEDADAAEVVDEIEDADEIEEAGEIEDADEIPEVEDSDPALTAQSGSAGLDEPDESNEQWLDEDYASWVESDTSRLDSLTEELTSDLAGAVEAELHAGPESAAEAQDVPEREISFAREPRRWWVGMVAAVFLLALIGQVFYFQLPTWSLDPDIRPLYESACRWMGCELPELRDLRKMRTRNLVVRSHPDLSGALIVDAVIVNQARFDQSFPDLNLSFTAVDGQLVASRQFAPAEYLAGELAEARIMPADTPIQVSLEIQDPGRTAVNYTLSFR